MGDSAQARYACCHFRVVPPWTTDKWWLACVWLAWHTCLMNEVWVIDERTGKRYVW